MQCDFEGHFSYLSPYFDILKLDPCVQVYFAIGVRETGSCPISFLEEQGVPRNSIIFPADYVRLLNFDVYLSPTVWGNIFPRNKNCFNTQLFHTLADKGIQYGKELLNFNTIFLNGPLHETFMDKYIFSKYPESTDMCKTYDVGFAKIDNLFNGFYDDSEHLSAIREKAGKKKIVLYAPNWEGCSALHKFGEDVFRELSGSDYFVLIKLHYMSLLSPENLYATGGVDWASMLDRYRDCENMYIVDDKNINPYLIVADCMITDYGGASFEFITLDKPLVYFDCPGFFEERGHHIFEKEARTSGHLIDNVSDLIASIDESLQDDPYSVERKRIASQLVYNRGMAADAGARLLKELVEKAGC